jgi:hypothetical protein
MPVAGGGEPPERNASMTPPPGSRSIGIVARGFAAARASQRSVRWAWALWLVMLLVVSGLILAGNRKTVTGAYRDAALHWIGGQNVYTASGGGFLYLPAAALAYVPFAVLPAALGEIAWRVLTIGTYAWAVSRLATLLRRQTGREVFLIATLVTLPLCWSSARNGQATLPMTGLMILGAVAAAESRWWLSALWLALAVAIKPLAIVMLLLVGGIHAPVRWRLIPALVGVLAVPFLFQSPQYVAQQYWQCCEMFRHASDIGLKPVWPQLFCALEVWGLPTSARVQTAVRVLAAAATFALAIRAVRTWPPAWAVLHTFTLAACYLMLFNPRTENNTYSCVAPAVGLALALSWRQPGQAKWSLCLALIALGNIGGWAMRELVGTGPKVWLAPLSTAIFAGFTVRQIVLGPSSLLAPVSTAAIPHTTPEPAVLGKAA